MDKEQQYKLRAKAALLSSNTDYLYSMFYDHGCPNTPEGTANMMEYMLEHAFTIVTAITECLKEIEEWKY